MMMKQVRLNKYLSECGIASRRKSEEIILEGRISVNDNIVINLSTMIDPGKDKVRMDGEPIIHEKHVYYLLNKPTGVVTTTSDEKKKKNSR